MSKRDKRHYHDCMVDHDASTLYIPMEFCCGGDLSSLVKRSVREAERPGMLPTGSTRRGPGTYPCNSSSHSCTAITRTLRRGTPPRTEVSRRRTSGRRAWEGEGMGKSSRCRFSIAFSGQMMVRPHVLLAQDSPNDTCSTHR
jgi:hypothetical protein